MTIQKPKIERFYDAVKAILETHYSNAINEYNAIDAVQIPSFSNSNIFIGKPLAKNNQADLSLYLQPSTNIEEQNSMSFYQEQGYIQIAVALRDRGAHEEKSFRRLARALEALKNVFITYREELDCDLRGLHSPLYGENNLFIDKESNELYYLAYATIKFN